MTKKPEPHDDWFREMDAGLEDAPGALAVPGGGEYTYGVPEGMSVQDLVVHAEVLLVELHSLVPDARRETQRELDVVLAAFPEKIRGFLGDLARDLQMLDGIDEPDGSEPIVGPPFVAAMQRSDSATLLRALRAGPSLFPEAMRAELRGRSWGLLGFRKAATVFFEHAYALAPQPPQLALVLDSLRLSGHKLEAALRARELLAGEPPPIVALAAARALMAGSHYLGRERPTDEELIRITDRAVQGLETLEARLAHPSLLRSFSHTLTSQAHILQRSGQAARAIEVLDRAVEADPTNPLARLSRAAIHMAHQPEQARTDLEALVESRFALPEPYVWLAHLMLRSNEPAASEQVARAALQWPTVPEVEAALHELLGIALAKQGRFAEAKAALERASSLQPQDTSIRANLAVLAEAMTVGNKASALKPRAPRFDVPEPILSDAA